MSIKATMVTKDYLDEKIGQLRGDLVALARKGNTKLSTLVEELVASGTLRRDIADRILALGAVSAVEPHGLKSMKKLFPSLFLVLLVGSGCVQMSKPGAAETKKAIERKDPSMCLKLSERTPWYTSKDGDQVYATPKSDCLFAFVENTNNVRDCDLIRENLGKDKYIFCIDNMARVHSDPTICDQRKEPAGYPLGYIYCVARATLDPEKCIDIQKFDKIGIPKEKLASDLGDCLLTVGAEKQDYRVCEKINGEESGLLRNWCLGRIAACDESLRKPKISTEALCGLMVEGTRPGSAKNLELERCQQREFGDCYIPKRLTWPNE